MNNENHFTSVDYIYESLLPSFTSNIELLLDIIHCITEPNVTVTNLNTSSKINNLNTNIIGGLMDYRQSNKDVCY